MQALITKYVGPTSTKGSRIQVKGWNKTIYVSWDHSLNSSENHKAAAEHYVFLLNKERNTEGCVDSWEIVSNGAHPEGKGEVFIISLK